MSRDVWLTGPPADLLRAVEQVVPGWYRRIVGDAARRAGVDPSSLAPEIDALVAREAPRLVASVADLLATDVDDQRGNPLGLFRAAIAAPTATLRAAGVPEPARDRFASDHFPADVYGLGPATWADIDESLHEPGIAWGAWKAMTVLRRRRDEGLR